MALAARMGLRALTASDGLTQTFQLPTPKKANSHSQISQQLGINKFYCWCTASSQTVPEWDDQMESFETGWASFFDVLRLYLTRFYKQPCSAFRIMMSTADSESDAWKILEQAFLPAVGGRAQPRESSKHAREALLLLDAPAPGLVLAGAYTWGNKVHASLSFYFFGAEGPAVAAREEPRWTAWLEQKFA